MIHPLNLVLAASSALAGEFPIGLYNVPTPESLAAVAAAGFTHILPAGNQEAVSEAARSLGLAVVGFPRPGEPSPAHGAHTAAWYLADEPEINGQSPETIARLAADVRRWDPRTPVVLVVGDGARAADYAASVDAIMVDWYPVPHLPLESFGAQISTALAAVGATPVWGVVQAMDWRDYPQRDPRRERIGRFPTHAELRFMSLDAVVRGASGLFFFECQRRSSPGQTLLDFPERWQAVARVAQELRTVKPWLEAGPGTPLTYASLEGRRWRARKKDLVVLINRGTSPTRIPAEYLEGGWAAVFESAIDPRRALQGGALPPKQVLILARG